MSPEQLQMLREKITIARQPIERTEQYAFPRGWNAALDHVEKVIKEVVGEKA